MKIDEQTLYDLDIFSKNHKDKCIFDFFNKASTNGGSAKIKHHFINPKNSMNEIISTQEILKYYIERIDRWELNIFKSICDNIEKYLLITIIPITGNSFIKVLVESISYKKYFSELSSGVELIRLFLNNVKLIISTSNHLPDSLKSKFESAHKLFKNPKIESLVKRNHKRLHFVNVLKYDKLFRVTLCKDLENLLNLIYEIDAYLGMAKSMVEYNLVFPKFVESSLPQLNIQNLYHIFLKDSIKNNISLDNNSNFLFLTGPNMSGKTTFMKACALAVYLSHIGLGVPASKMQLSSFDLLFSSINTEDNIRIGYSYYYSEVKRIKEIAILLNKNQKALVVFDEMFKGTNVHDAYEASKLVLSGFSEWPESIFILSSHLVELEKEMSGFSNFGFKYFEAKIENGKPEYSYKLKDGVSHERHGVLILEQEKVLELLKRTLTK